jgi:DNA repair protein RecO (recombination protein O)
MLPADSVALARRMFRGTVKGLADEWAKDTGGAEVLRRFAIEVLERHLERRLVSARGL